jgi:hypothetical protein
MTESQIQMEENIYMAMVDLKNDIMTLRATNKDIQEKLKKCEHLCFKTSNHT